MVAKNHINQFKKKKKKKDNKHASLQAALRETCFSV